MIRYETENGFGKGVVLSWASILDENCREQAEAISRVPILDGHLALMPDAHFGFGPPVGSALRTRGAIMPYAVGVDIGCGMIAIETDLERGALVGKEGAILGGIRAGIPSGVGTSHPSPTAASARFFEQYGMAPGAVEGQMVAGKKTGLVDARHRPMTDTARIQFGTLGAGNHFVEVSATEEGRVWVVLHSGSRGIGNQLATMHVKHAQDFATKEGIALEDKDFAYVPMGTWKYNASLADMLWAQTYAREQREAMMDALIAAVEVETGRFSLGERINCHHNYAEQIAPGLWLTRKGAIDASLGMMGIIPGSMGAATHIVRGRGCAEAYNTAPHGAGRILGRKVDKKTLDVEAFRAQMAGKTWLDRDATALLDEAPGAYKPIEAVIADSAALIEPVAALSQFINYKGL